MKGGGILIRLIDIVMILLMGFLVISDIIPRAEIKLPSGRKKSQSQKKNRPMEIEIEVVKSDTVMDLEWKGKKETIPKSILSQKFIVYKIAEDEKYFQVRSLERLEDELFRIKTSYDSVLIKIQPDSNSIIQGMINLLDLCRDYNLKRTFNYLY